MTYSLWCSSLLWLGCGLGLSSSFWLRDLSDLRLRGSLGLCSRWLLGGCGLLGSGLLLVRLLLCLWLLRLGLGGRGLWLLLGELGSSRASCEVVRGAMPEVKRQARTLWLSEDTLLDTRLQGAVEQRVEHGVGRGDLVVGLDILLEGDAAMQESAVINR
jgi:hypothetical protein